MTTPLTNIGDLQSWTESLSGLVGFSGDPSLISSFDWSNLNRLTVADYLKRLDEAEQIFDAFDWSFLNSQLPFLEGILASQNLPQAQIDESLAVLRSFAAGDTSLITDSFEAARGFLAGVAPSTLLFDAVDGGGMIPDNSPTPDDDVLTGTKGNDIIKALAGDDAIFGRGGNDLLIGDAGDDEIDGGGGKDRLLGRSGKDDLTGGAGRDKLAGGGGADTLKGGKGGDNINGGKGADMLTGNGGSDLFVFLKRDGKDTITDFKVGVDEIKVATARDAADFTYTQQGADVLIEFDALDILVQNVTVAEMNDNDNFLF